MPTVLPPTRRNSQARMTGRRVFDVLFNGALLVSALILGCIVLVRGEQSSMSQQAFAEYAAQVFEASQQGRE